VKEAHENGIKIMLDAVFNHTGTDFPMWEDVIEKGQNSKYSDWYMINKWPIDLNHDTKDGGFYSFAFTQYMPKLNTNNPEVQSYLIDIVKYWINEFDIDGLRFDVGNEVSHSFLKKLRIVTKDIKSDFYLLGELWHDATNWLYGDEYDAVMNYPLATAIADFWIYKNRSRESFEYDINRCFTMYYQQANDVLLNLLDSHDTNRLLNKVGNDIDIFYQQLAVLFTMPGSPCIFYGTEIAMPGSYDPDCRRCMPWDEIDSGLHDSKINQVKELISVRKNNPACNSRNFHFPNEIPYSRVLEYIKLDEKQNIKVILNCEEKDIMLSNIDDSKILYSRKWNSGTLSSKGILITTID
nr:glycoside hydrolase family 13 protein [Butyrivibrio sp.]